MKDVLTASYGLFLREMIKWFRERYSIVFAFIVPIVWLVLFGNSFNLSYLLRVDIGVQPQFRELIQRAIENALLRVFGTLDYFNFFAVGMLSAFALFISMWSGMSLVWDRRLGYLERFLVAPIPRPSIYLSKVMASLVKGLIQFSVMLLVALAIGLRLKEGFSLVDLLATYAIMALLITALSALFTATALKISSHEVVISIANLVNLPLLFTSNAIFPLEQMPEWFRSIAAVNPLTHSITLTRYWILGIEPSGSLLLSALYIIAFTLAALTLGSLLSRRL